MQTNEVVGNDAASTTPTRRGVYVGARRLTSCRHRLCLDLTHPELVAHFPEDSGIRQRRDAATAHRAVVRERISAIVGGVQIDQAASWSARTEATMTACSDGVGYIWDAVLPSEPDTGREGVAELLIHDDDRGGYIPVIVVNHKVTDPRPDPSLPDGSATTSALSTWSPKPDPARKVRTQPGDQMRLAHLYRMLQRHGLASPAVVGGAIGFDADCILVHDLAPVLDEYDRRYADRITVARGEIGTEPSQIPECRSCPWWSRCQQWLVERHDVSLVAVGSRADVLRDEGVRTIDDLARWTGPPPALWQHGVFDDAVVTAKAWLAGAPLVRRVPNVSVPRADIEVDVDLESYQERGAYLWGALLNDTVAGTSSYRPFVTWEPLPTSDEARSYGEFWTWLMDLRAAAAAQGSTFAAYCYSRAAEDKWLLDSARRFAGAPGVPTVDQVREFIDGPQWVDIYQVVSDQFVCPNGKGLKKIAPVAGFRWRDPEASGEASMSWYREAVGYDGEPDPTQRRRILEYNEDDVLATKALREWMSGPADREVPFVDEL